MSFRLFGGPRHTFEDEKDTVVTHGDTTVRVGPHLEVESFEGDRMVVNMGPQHPSTHGVLRLELELDGEVITKVTPHIGYLHRCFEKHAESIPYGEVVPFVDRMDYLSSMNQGYGYVLGVERLLGIEVPERVEYLRVIFLELNRIASHLVAIGTYGLDVGAFTPFLWAFRDREKILDLFEWASGARLLYNYMWVGGLAREIPDGWLEKVREFLDYFGPKVIEFNKLLTENHIFIERTADVGILPADVAVNYGCTGPVLRGSGVAWDLRRHDPYSVYDRFDFDIAVGKGEFGPIGSALDRFLVRVWEMLESMKIIRQALDQMPSEGGVHDAVPRRLRPKAGSDIYVRTESARGELGFYIRSDGSDIPMRVKGRSPSFSNISVIEEISRGYMVADLVAIIGSLDIVLGEIDR
jgi:NADH-quinone oxidoreductase subunit D